MVALQTSAKAPWLGSTAMPAGPCPTGMVAISVSTTDGPGEIAAALVMLEAVTENTSTEFPSPLVT